MVERCTIFGGSFNRRLEDDKEKFKEEKTRGYVNLTVVNEGKTPDELAEEIWTIANPFSRVSRMGKEG